MDFTIKMNHRLRDELETQVILPAAHRQNDVAIEMSKHYTPVDTGLLQSSTVGEVNVVHDGVRSRISNPVYYAIFQEFGTSRFPGQFYFRRGMFASLKTFIGEVKNKMKGA